MMYSRSRSTAARPRRAWSSCAFVGSRGGAGTGVGVSGIGPFLLGSAAPWTAQNDPALLRYLLLGGAGHRLADRVNRSVEALPERFRIAPAAGHFCELVLVAQGLNTAQGAIDNRPLLHRQPDRIGFPRPHRVPSSCSFF